MLNINYKSGAAIIAAMGTAMLLSSCDMSPDDKPPTEVKSEDMAVKIPEARPDSVTDSFARLALQCVHREYPNKISHVLSSEKDALPPSKLTPAFYGCFDWHSSVHGHWLLVRILKTDPDSPMRTAIIAAMNESFTEKNMAAELTYYSADHRTSFERPYGIAWFLQLAAELHESDDPEMQKWRQTLRPLEAAIVERVKQWLSNLVYPIREGTHSQSAFAFGLMLDYARTVDDKGLEKILVDKAREFHAGDKNCPLAYEPSGEDFLSPCLMEADLMRRVLDRDEFALWLADFLPQIPGTAQFNAGLNNSAKATSAPVGTMAGKTDKAAKKPAAGAGSNARKQSQAGKAASQSDATAQAALTGWLAIGEVRDRTDGKLVHLDGLNLSRAWALEGIAQSLPVNDPRRAALLATSEKHKKAGLESISDKNYEGSHWLGSFATYLVTHRGAPVDTALVGEESQSAPAVGSKPGGEKAKPGG